MTKREICTLILRKVPDSTEADRAQLYKDEVRAAYLDRCRTLAREDNSAAQSICAHYWRAKAYARSLRLLPS